MAYSVESARRDQTKVNYVLGARRCHSAFCRFECDSQFATHSSRHDSTVSAFTWRMRRATAERRKASEANATRGFAGILFGKCSLAIADSAEISPLFASDNIYQPEKALPGQKRPSIWKARHLRLRLGAVYVRARLLVAGAHLGCEARNTTYATTSKCAFARSPVKVSGATECRSS